MAQSSGFGHHVRGTKNYIYYEDRVIGRGAMATVFLARHRKKGHKYAAKVFKYESRNFTEDYIQKELDILAHIPVHANILVAEDFEEETYSKNKVVIMKLCEMSLQQILEQPENCYGLSEEEFLILYRDIVQALQHLYEHKIVHRDIKPGNILLQITPDGRHVYKLGDFGAAKILEDDDNSFKTLCGTEEYLHPDLHYAAFVHRIGTNEYDRTIDFWSFGVTLYQAACGHLPFMPSAGIRNDKKMMQELMTNRDSTVISQVQMNDGRKLPNKNLPQTCRLTSGTRDQTEGTLRTLFDHKGSHGTFDALRFFHDTNLFFRKIQFHVIYVETLQQFSVYLHQTDKLTHLLDVIAEVTELPAGSQDLYINDERLSDIVGMDDSVNDYPNSSMQSPFILINKKSSTDISSYLKTAMVNLQMIAHLQPDEELPTDPAKLSGRVWQVKRDVEHMVLLQNIIIKVRYTMRNHIERKLQLVAVTLKAADTMSKHQTQLCQSLDNHLLVCNISNTQKRIARLQTDSSSEPTRSQNEDTDMVLLRRDINSCETDSHLLLNKNHKVHQSLRSTIPLSKKQPTPICMAEHCCRKADILVEEAMECCATIQELDRKLDKSHNDQEIIKYNRNEMRKCLRRLLQLLEDHCFQMTKFLHQETIDIISVMKLDSQDISKLESSVHQLQKRQHNCSEKINKLLTTTSPTSAKDRQYIHQLGPSETVAGRQNTSVRRAKSEHSTNNSSPIVSRQHGEVELGATTCGNDMRTNISKQDTVCNLSDGTILHETSSQCKGARPKTHKS